MCIRDSRIGVDVMTTETTCLSSIWRTDDQVKEFYEIHGRTGDFEELNPGYMTVSYTHLDVYKRQVFRSLLCSLSQGLLFHQNLPVHAAHSHRAVSYTHLDVYKRQGKP